MISERHERLILEEYAVAGLLPVRRSDGELVTLGLARKLGTPLLSLLDALEAQARYSGAVIIVIDTWSDHPTDAYREAGE